MTLGMKRLLGVLLAMVLLGAACSSDGSSAVEATSPLQELLGEDVLGFNFDPDDPASQARFNEQEQLRQEQIATCMSEQGFEYIPVDQSSFDFASFNDGLDYDSREYAERFGFGITTQYLPQATVGPDLVGYDDTIFEDFESADPNQEIVEAMDPSTQEAYYEALWGEEPEFDASFDAETATEEELEEQFAFEPQGCYGEAFESDKTTRFYDDFQDELEDMYEAIEADPRIVAARQEAEDCIADAGYQFSPDSDGYQALFDRFQDGLSEVDAETGGSPFDTMTEEDFAAMSEDEIEAMFNVTPELTDRGKQLLGELQAEETAMAVAVHDCGGGFGDEESIDLYREVSVEYEERFIEQNADRLDAFRS
ncbi:MAG: hypothetical protein AAF531_19225 [Actinomycetota bacterium]